MLKRKACEKYKKVIVYEKCDLQHIEDALIYLLVHMCNGMDIEKGMVSCTNAFLFSLALRSARSTPTHQAKHMQLHCSSSDSDGTYGKYILYFCFFFNDASIYFCIICSLLTAVPKL